jgi:hypothetical protein
MARDIIHHAVKNALIKEGWTITHDPFRVEYKEFQLFVDLAAERSPIAAERDGRKILVEIKSFVGRSFIEDLQKALGQWLIYLDLIEMTAPDYELFIAVNEWSYNKHFRKEAAQWLLQKHQIAVIVVDAEEEQIVAWINSPDTKR